MKNRIGAFLADRLPFEDVKNHFKKPLPKHINWLFSLGGMAAFLLILQAVTGAFLAFYYSPSPDHAYDAVKYISGEVAFRRLCARLAPLGCQRDGDCRVFASAARCGLCLL